MEREHQVSIRALEWDEPRPVIFIHGDVDGMIAACLFVRSRGEQAIIRFTGARRLASDLQALGDRISEGLGVTEILIGNVPVRPASIGAIRQVVAQEVPVIWVDHHSTRQDLLDEVAAIDGVTFLHETEVEGPPSGLVAQMCELTDSQTERLLQVAQGADAEDPWILDRHTLLSAFIGRGDPDTLRRLAMEEELSEQDREAIEAHVAREAAADEFVGEVEHPTHDIHGHTMVLLDARGRELGYLPRRVEARYPDADLRILVVDDGTILVTASEKGRDLVRLLRSLPWPSGVFVGGRPHQVRVSPGDLGMDGALAILCDPNSWPQGLEAAPARSSRSPQGSRRSPPRRGSSGHGSGRGFFAQVVEQRVIADLLEEALRDDHPLEVFRGEGDASCATFVLVSDGVVRHISMYCSRVNASVERIPVSRSVLRINGGCAIWARAEANPEDGYLDVVYGWFGRDPGQRPPSADGGRGTHAEIPHGRFDRISSPDELAEALFGWR